MIDIRKKYGKSDNYGFYWECIKKETFDERISSFEKVHKDLTTYGDAKEIRRILTCEMMIDFVNLQKLITNAEIEDIPKINSSMNEIFNHRWKEDKQFISDINVASRLEGQLTLLFYFFKSFNYTNKQAIYQLYRFKRKAKLDVMFISVLASISVQLDPTKNDSVKRLIRESTFRAIKRLVNYERIDFEEERQWVSEKMTTVGNEDEIVKLIKKGEGFKIEFKSTFIFDVKKNNFNTELKKENLKEIIAFANSLGGTIIFGIDDNGLVLGLENTDFMRYEEGENKPDKLFNELIDTLKHTIDTPALFNDLIDVEYKTINGKTILIIKIGQSQIPVYFFDKNKNQTEFYVRQGSQKTKIEGKELIEYNQKRFS